MYFSKESTQQFETGDVRVPVNFKLDDDDRPYPLCYCFGYGKEDVASELARTGETTVVDWITERVQAEECTCRWKNPRGGCCLSDVRNALGELQ